MYSLHLAGRHVHNTHGIVNNDILIYEVHSELSDLWKREVNMSTFIQHYQHCGAHETAKS